MSQIFSGVFAMVSGADDVAVLSEIVSSVDYDTLKELNKGRPLSITREQFENFIGNQAESLMNAGLLDSELVPTSKITTPLH